MVVWRRQPVDLTSFTTQYVERGVDLVALALQWDRGLQALEREARHDALTGLANRRAFFDRLRSSAPPDTPGTVLFCDLDQFKPVNDVHGHTVGDQLLVVVGERLQRAVRPTDLVSRYGGDEFTVFCPGLVDENEIAALTDRLRRVVSSPISVGGVTVEVGITIGVAGAGRRERDRPHHDRRRRGHGRSPSVARAEMSWRLRVCRRRRSGRATDGM